MLGFSFCVSLFLFINRQADETPDESSNVNEDGSTSGQEEQTVQQDFEWQDISVEDPLLWFQDAKEDSLVSSNESEIIKDITNRFELKFQASKKFQLLNIFLKKDDSNKGKNKSIVKKNLKGGGKLEDGLGQSKPQSSSNDESAASNTEKRSAEDTKIEEKNDDKFIIAEEASKSVEHQPTEENEEATTNEDKEQEKMTDEQDAGKEDIEEEKLLANVEKNEESSEVEDSENYLKDLEELSDESTIEEVGVAGPSGQRTSTERTKKKKGKVSWADGWNANKGHDQQPNLERRGQQYRDAYKYLKREIPNFYTKNLPDMPRSAGPNVDIELSPEFREDPYPDENNEMEDDDFEEDEMTEDLEMEEGNDEDKEENDKNKPGDRKNSDDNKKDDEKKKHPGSPEKGSEKDEDKEEKNKNKPDDRKNSDDNKKKHPGPPEKDSENE